MYTDIFTGSSTLAVARLEQALLECLILFYFTECGGQVHLVGMTWDHKAQISAVPESV